MRITVSGLPGSGTTSLGKGIASECGYTFISAGEVFRECARERNMDLASFGKLAENDPSIDRLIDERQKEIGMSSDDIIIEGRLAGWMVENADLRIWLSASPKCRSARIAERDIQDGDTATAITLERERSEAQRYTSYYGIDINDLSCYDLILSSELFGRTSLVAIVGTAVNCLLKD
ncbi:MAG: cytidylate kinase [Methanocalculus sp. MSAO_Arc1]|uniref:(d)CMP kinase n=1 Tax=Methanocalculus TaxID=71151 RepID=UPI000FF48FCB|nr:MULTISPECIES: AAA family ATPase [unclassified Methanocalculus]MCP1663004.1 cytidylate kinase [Methanocalculus sp. AMF5]RQD80620.1 MAG: cytidylate kinase [Methanocalculus sp. MSAO_Arc1]